MRVELEHGQWAELRDDVEEISNRDRQPIMDLYADPAIPAGFGRSYKANRLLLNWLISGWSLVDPQGAPRPLPREQPGVLDEIRARDFDLLIKAADDMSTRIFADLKVNPDPNPAGGSSNGSVSAPEGMPPSSTSGASPSSTGSTSSAGSSAGQ